MTELNPNYLIYLTYYIRLVLYWTGIPRKSAIFGLDLGILGYTVAVEIEGKIQKKYIG